MGNTLQVKRGTNLSNAGTPAAGELIYKTDTNELFVGDGSTAATSLTAIGGSGSGDIEGVTAGTGLSGGGTSGTVSLAVDLSELTDMTASVNSSEDELIILDNGADRRKLISEIPLSAFNNDSGFITSTLTTEAVQDIVGAMFSSNTETRISATYQDGDGTIDLVVDDMTANDNTQLSNEQVQDIVGAMFSGNTETRITATYQDSDGTIDLVVDDLDTDTQLTTENVQDIVGAMFSSNTETRISATYQDGDGTIDLVVDDMTTDTNTNQLTTFTLTADSGSNQTIAHGNTLDIAGGTNCTTSVGATDTVTINVDDSFIKNNADDTSSGNITAAGLTVSGSNALTLPASHYVGKIVLYSGGNEKIGTEANTILFTADNHKFKDTNGDTNVTFNNAGQIAAASLDISGDIDVDGTANFDAIDLDGNLDMRADDVDAARYIHMPRGGGITFYGDASQHHGIFSRNDSNTTAQDDILITSYGAIYFDLDSNDNNTSNASFEIGKHNTANDPIFMVDGETGHVGINENSLDADLHITGSPVVVKLERAGQRAFRFGVPDDSTKFIMADSDDLKSDIAIEIDNSRNVKITENLEVVGDLDVDGTTNLDAVDIDGVITAADGSASAPQYSFGADTNSGMFRVSSDVVGIAAAGNSRFTVKGNGIKAVSGSLGVNTDPNSTDGMIHATNDIVAFSSDKRLKQNIRPIENALDKVSKLSGFVYNWNELANEKAQYDMDKDYVGVYAQDVEEVQPEAVDLAPFDNDGEDKSISGDKYLTVQYEKLVPLLIESIKELKAEIEELKK